MTSSNMRRTIQGAITAVSQAAFIDSNGFTLQSTGTVKSISTMTFAPNGKLLVADSQSNAIHALSLPEIETAKSGSFNLYGVDKAISQALNIDSDRI